MNAAKGKITQVQLVSIGVCFLMGTILRSVFISTTSGNDSWLMGFSGFICFLPAVFVYISLSRRFPGKNLFKINEEVLGSVAGRILSFIYLLFFISICALNVMDSANFLNSFMLVNTPTIPILTVFMLSSVYCVNKGIAPIARLSTFFALFAAILVFINTIFSFQHANFDFIRPMLNRPIRDYVQSTHIATAIPYGNSIFTFMLLPDFADSGKFKKSYLILLILTPIIMLIIHLRDIVVLGPLLSFATLPSFESIRMAGIANIITHSESLFAVLLLTLGFFKILIIFYVCLQGFIQIFRVTSPKSFSPLLAIIIAVYSLTIYSTPANSIFWAINVIPFIWSAFNMLIPILLFCIAFLKSHISLRLKRSTL